MKRRMPPDEPAALLEYALDCHGDTVFRLALAQTGSVHDAEDASQDAFLRLLETKTHFGSDEHLKAWLPRVTINRCHDFARMRTRKPTSPIDSLPFEPEAPQHDDGARDAMLAAWRAISNLPEDQRVVVHLVCVEGYSASETARILNVSAQAVRSRLSRARKTLRNTARTQAAAENTASNAASPLPLKAAIRTIGGTHHV